MKISNSKSTNSKYRRITDYRENNLNSCDLARAMFREERDAMKEARRNEQRERRIQKRNKTK